MDSTSVSLLKRLRNSSDELAWKRFVNLYAPLIFHWGRSQQLTADDAAELVQEVMQILVVKMREFEYNPDKRFRGWLRTVTANKANDIHRHNGVRRTTQDERSIRALTADDNVDLFAETEYQQFLAQRAMQLMKAEFDEISWRACHEHLIEGKKADQIARELGITVNMVYLAKSRILARIRQELSGLID
jgi:RNA polymerase sigma-70 factor (ECF subfamily)